MYVLQEEQQLRETILHLNTCFDETVIIRMKQNIRRIQTDDNKLPVQRKYFTHEKRVKTKQLRKVNITLQRICKKEKQNTAFELIP